MPALIRSRIRWAALAALSLPMLVAGGPGGAAENAPGRKVLATSREGGVRREIYVDGAPGRETASAEAPRVPMISFIDSPSVQCVQPDPRQDVCYVDWGYSSVTAGSSQYMVAMWYILDSKVVGRVAGFFQTSMFVPGPIFGRGIRVKCGPPVDDSSSCSPQPCTALKVGNSYPWEIRALETGGLRSANYGSVACPAFMGGRFYPLSPCRVLDTRNTPNGPLAGPALQPNATRTFKVSASGCGIPAGAWAISLNVTVTGASSSGNLVLHAGGTSAPPTTNINFAFGKTRANNALVSLASDMTGTIEVTNRSVGTVHLILDVNGYFQ